MKCEKTTSPPSSPPRKTGTSTWGSKGKYALGLGTFRYSVSAFLIIHLLQAVLLDTLRAGHQGLPEVRFVGIEEAAEDA